MSNKHRSKFSQYIISVLAVCIVAGISFLLNTFIDYKVIAFLLLVTVSILAMLFDIFPVLLAAILSALVWNFFFIPPRFTFSIGTTEDQLLFLMYFIIASINAVLTYKIRQIEKQAMEKEEKERSIELYNTLFNSLSHELQTPISTIIGASDMLKESNTKLSEKNKHDLVSEISIASLRLNEQVENLLSMSRLETGHLRLKTDWCDINEMVYSAVNKLKDRLEKHKITIEIAENFPLFKLDFGIMEQVIYNLIINSVQYTPEHSTISIHAACGVIAKESTLLSDSTFQNLILTISDNGKGFPENEMEKIFDKFYRLHNTRVGGTGLGLSIVKGFVEAHKGTIRLKNSSTGGAKFIIEIPAPASSINALKHE